MRVFILDDSSIMRGRLTKLLSLVGGIEIVGEASDPIEAFKPITTMKPDVIILDIRIRKKYGTDILRRIGDIKPSPSVIALSHRFFLPADGKDAGGPVGYFLDRFTEWKRVPEVLKLITPEARMEPAGVPS